MPNKKIHDPQIDKAIRKIPNFPKAGVLFYDLTTLFLNPTAFSYTVGRMLACYADKPLDAVAAVEARGFLLAAPFAERRSLPLILLRKAGKLPGETIGREFELEYGTDSIEVQRHDVPAGARILVVDDLIATGGTTAAGCALLEEAGGKVAGVFAVVGLPFLQYQTALAQWRTTVLHCYHHENVDR